jgi:CO/xanthine dehydrogenase Mo-binding subunit
MAVTEENPGYKWVGTRPIRPDGLEKVTGKAQFGADLMLPGMLFGKVVRSPHAHAQIISIDTTAAEAMAGVKAVITGSDFPDLAANGAHPSEIDVANNAIARDKVLYEGHVVAAVAATTRDQAEAAAKAVEVTYEILPHVLTVDEAMADGAPLLHEGMITKGVDPAPEEPSNVASKILHERGDLDQGFGEAEAVVDREFTTKPVHQGYIEPHAAVADANSDGRAHIWCSSQGHFQMRASSATVLGVSPGMLKVTAAEIGGGFGGKTVIYLEPLAVRLSQRAGRPVKLVMDRDEVFRATGPTSGTRIRVKMGVSKDGKITAAEVWMAYEAGAYAGSPVGAAGMTAIACYDIPNFVVEGYDVVCNKPRVAAYRAPGAPMAAFAVESVLDELARDIGMDPIDIRLVNAAVEGTQASYGPKFPRIGFVETLEAIKDHPSYTADLGPNQGRGVAAGFWFNAGMMSSATVHINENGTATVVTGSPDIGGSRQSMALMAAEELGIAYESIKAVVADTETVGFTDVTGGSRVTLATGAAVVDACRLIVEDLRARAAKTWDVELDQVEWVDGQAQHVEGAQPPLSLNDLAAKSGRTGGPISANASLNSRGVGAGFSTQLCDVEVDPETGVTRVIRYLTAQDAGRAISPDYVEGQMQGGVVQGIGWALNEEYIHDNDGVMENPSFLDYRMPVASDLPMIDCAIVEVPNPAHPYGVRGVGEVGIVPPMAAVGNAINDALNVRMTDLPMSPVRILEALNDQRD